MTNHPEIVLPPGFEAVTDDDGKVIVRKSEDSALTQSVSFRVTTGEKNRLMLFVETFDSRSWSESFRWLLAQPAVVAAIQGRIDAGTVPA